MQQEMDLINNLNKIKYKIVVMSGKGGVGKSTVAANIAETFQNKVSKPGILDVDIHGPNIPKLMEQKEKNTRRRKKNSYQ